MDLLTCAKSVYESIIVPVDKNPDEYYKRSVHMYKTLDNHNERGIIEFTKKLYHVLKLDNPLSIIDFNHEDFKLFYEKSIMLLERREKLKKILKNV